ncbi:isoleucine--tRNA ligase [Ruminococcaceae bacterium OttesenSCG-928-I18]|nr:isoleucine--tRNA ligase [Ruminococcaceae bacterium OttesenSCG-928-I18]
MAQDYNNTLNLPDTEFSMRAGLPNKEPKMLQAWEEDGLYAKMVENNEGKPVYILHDGPPYANASIHMGTAMNKVLKDIIVRYKNMAGFKAPYVPGWDCHGLPIERKAMEEVRKNQKKEKKKTGQEPKALSDYEMRELCYDYAMRFVDVQRNQFKRLGALGDWEDPYLTLAPGYEAKQIEIFGEMAKKGYIYKGLKPVIWCAHDKTALAEAEIEYENDPVDTLYVAFQVKKDNGVLQKAGLDPEKVWFVIWTTTAWTLPANVAICLGPDFDYVAVKAGERVYIVAEALLESTMASCHISEYETLATFKGKDLERIETQHCYLDRRSLVILGDHVTLESGTGCVHTAPGHGVEDYDVVSRHYPELPMIVPVNDVGIFTEEVGPFEGMTIWEASPKIVEFLQQNGTAIGVTHETHQYPHCWRCHNPILFRATEQWFCSVEDFREETYKAIDSVQWVPEWGQGRMTAMVRDRADWTISRQRLWGMPIPVFYCEACGEYVIDDETISAVQELFAKEGSNAWFKYSAEEILPAGYKCKCGASQWRKEKDTMDVWFDSGTSHAYVLEKWKDHHWPADLYLEGSDQFRGWFQSSLLTAVATRGVSPYKTVVSAGWVVDGEGRKMSKSLGNGIEPEQVIKEYGADIIRLWVAAADYHADMRISKEILKQLSEGYRKIRNTARFMLGNLSDFNPDTDSVTDGELLDLDRWALAELDELAAIAKEGYDTFDFHKVYHNAHRFCVVSMSNFYLDIIKDRLYITPKNGSKRRAAQTAMFRILVSITEILAPILAFTSQEIWEYIPSFKGKQKYAVMHEMPKPGTYTLTETEREKWDTIIAITADVKKVLENARTNKEIGSSLEASVLLHCDDKLYSFTKDILPELADIFIVSEVQAVLDGEGEPGEVEGLKVEVRHASGDKCERCWQYRDSVSEGGSHPGLCDRCAGILSEA